MIDCNAEEFSHEIQHCSLFLWAIKPDFFEISLIIRLFRHLYVSFLPRRGLISPKANQTYKCFLILVGLWDDGLQFSQSVEAGPGYGLHISQGKALFKEFELVGVVQPHLLVRLAPARLSAHLAAKVAIVVIAALHPAADEGALHGVKLCKDSQHQLRNRVRRAVWE